MKEIEKILKFSQSYFKSQNFEEGGFVFEFVKIEIEPNFVDAIKLLVNVILPDPNQSYVIGVFNKMIQDIILNSFNFLGEHFSFSLEITVDGNEIFDETAVYIREKQLVKILEKVNIKFSEVGVSIDWGQGDKILNMKCLFAYQSPAYYENEGVTFNLKMGVSNLTLDSQPVKIKPNKLNEFSYSLYSTLIDRDWFLSGIEDIMYSVIMYETKLDLVDDVYASANVILNSINSKKVKPEGNYYQIRKDNFIEIS